MAGTDRARHDAGRQLVFLRQVVVVDPVDAQRAFLHDPAIRVEFPCAIRTGPGAQLAADADRFVDQHDPVFGALVGGPRRAHGNASRLLAMQARFGEIDGPRTLSVAFLEGVDAVQPNPPSARAIRVEIGQRADIAAGIPLLAGSGTGLAAHTDVEVDDQAELLRARPRLRQRGHRDARAGFPLASPRSGRNLERLVRTAAAIA